jgi:transketolase
LTGDLGFMALENVEKKLGDRFINVGVAEQNMIGVAAGLAREGNRVIAYSIAPFCYARPFEQIRNDICLSNLPVCIVGNGGGFAYGHMGPTHHALEDCAAMNALGVKVIAPAFDDDISAIIAGVSMPTYLRLGYDVRPKGLDAPPYAPWRRLLDGRRGALVALGPLAGVAWSVLLDTPADQRPAVWALTEFEFDCIPEQFFADVRGNSLLIIEEHVVAGGLGMNLSLAVITRGVSITNIVHHHALRYPSGKFGSQSFHRAECGLDEAGVRKMVEKLR